MTDVNAGLTRPAEAPLNTRPEDGWPETDTRAVAVEAVEREEKRRDRDATNVGQDPFTELDDGPGRAGDEKEREESFVGEGSTRVGEDEDVVRPRGRDEPGDSGLVGYTPPGEQDTPGEQGVTPDYRNQPE